MKGEMKKIATQTNANLANFATPADMQLFFTYQSICNPKGKMWCLNGYAWTVGNICLDPSEAVSITTGGHYSYKSNKWISRSILQIAKTAAHEMGTVSSVSSQFYFCILLHFS